MGRQSIVDAVGTRLAGVAGIVGVHEWRLAPLALADLPALLYGDTADTVGAPAYGEIRHDLAISIVVTTEGATAVDDLRGYIDATLTAIGTDPTWGGLAETTRLDEIEIEPEQTDRIYARGRIGITVTYTTGLWAS